jgi:hypothetical protein
VPQVQRDRGRRARVIFDDEDPSFHLGVVDRPDIGTSRNWPSSTMMRPRQPTGRQYSTNDIPLHDTGRAAATGIHEIFTTSLIA